MLATWELIARLALAAVLGAAIGFERERLLWAAGLRTHMLVCVSSSLIMIVSAFGFADVLGMPDVVLDPSRIAAQVVSGIGFLGAGSILLRGEVIRGLTTAASLWSVAAVGLAAGGGLYAAAVAATLIILLILAGIKPLEKRYRTSRHLLELRLLAARGALSFDVIRQALGATHTHIAQFIVQQSEMSDLDEVTIVLSHVRSRESAAIIKALRKLPSVREVEDTAGAA